jgi:hypothetical protein
MSETRVERMLRQEAQDWAQDDPFLSDACDIGREAIALLRALADGGFAWGSCGCSFGGVRHDDDCPWAVVGSLLSRAGQAQEPPR